MESWETGYEQSKPELVSFGDEPHQVMTPEIMHRMVRDLFATDRPTFARFMARAYGMSDEDIKPAPRARRRGGDAAG